MKKVMESAAFVASQIPPAEDGTKAIGVMEIVAIIRLLIATYECFKGDPYNAAVTCRSPSILQRARLSYIVVKVLGPKASATHGRAVMKALLKLGEKTYSEDVIEMIKELEEEGG